MRVSINYLPNNIEEFKNMPTFDLTKPENTCVMFLCALNVYINNVEDGLKALNLLRGVRPLNKFDIQFVKDRLRDRHYLALAYYEGATPENNYEVKPPYVLEIIDDPRPQDIEEGYIRFFLHTKGADSPRPIKLRRKGNEWFIWEYSSILSGIRIPVKEDPWA